MNTLVLVEHDNKLIHPATTNLVRAALEFDPNPIVLVIGYQCSAVAEQVALISGVHAVWLVDNLEYAHHLAEPISELVLMLAASFSVILAPASTFGKNVLPRIAAKLDVIQLSDVTRIIDHKTFEHPIYAGNAIETLEILDSIKMLTIRTTAFDAIYTKQNPCAIEVINKPVHKTCTTFIKQESTASQRPNLSSAKIVVSGGRGLQDAEKFKLIYQLADVLGAAVGASRAAVDAGFIANEYQVGQTGKIVAPALYFAIGISGAIQHIAGMKDSKIIVAINKDEDAPIFQIANYYLVGDLFELVPQLIEQLSRRL